MNWKRLMPWVFPQQEEDVREDEFAGEGMSQKNFNWFIWLTLGGLAAGITGMLYFLLNR